MGGCHGKAKDVKQKYKEKKQKHEASHMFQQHIIIRSGLMECTKLRKIIRVNLGIFLTPLQMKELLKSVRFSKTSKVNEEEFIEIYCRVQDRKDPCNLPLIRVSAEDVEAKSKAKSAILDCHYDGAFATTTEQLEAMEEELLESPHALQPESVGERMKLMLQLATHYTGRKHIAKARDMITQVSDLERDNPNVFIQLPGDEGETSFRYFLAAAEAGLMCVQGRLVQAKDAYRALIAALPSGSLMLSKVHKSLSDLYLKEARRKASDQRKAKRTAKKEKLKVYETVQKKVQPADKNINQIEVLDVNAGVGKAPDGLHISTKDCLDLAGTGYIECISLVESKEKRTREQLVQLSLGYKGLALVYQSRVALLAESDKNLKYAELAYMKALVLQEKLYDASNFELASTYSNLGGLYTYINFSKPCHEKGVEMYCKAMGYWKNLENVSEKQTKGLSVIYNNLYALYHKAGDEEKAKHYYHLFKARQRTKVDRAHKRGSANLEQETNNYI